MKRFSYLLPMAAIGAAGVTAGHAAPRVPTGPWTLSVADGQCIALRDYGSAAAPLSLVIEASPLGGLMQVSVILDGKGPWEPKERQASIQFDDQPPVQVGLLSFASKNEDVRTLRMNMAGDTFAPMRRASRVSIRSGDVIAESFALEPMEKLMAAMDRCVANSQAHWNIGEAAQAKLRQRAKPLANLAAYVSNDDFPAIAVSNLSNGTVRFVLLIDEEGKVADCMVTETSQEPSLDAQTCAIMLKRPRFTPAIDADGKPARDFHTGGIRWIVPTRISDTSRIDE